MDSVDSNVDLELIAAFIDGRVSGEDRARVVKLLADSDEALELYAHALREHHARSDVKVVPIARPRRWTQWKVLVPLVAAAGLAIVTVPRLTGRHTQTLMASGYVAELGRDARFADGLREGWQERGWSVTRGAGTSREPTGSRLAGTPQESRLAFRLGVRTVDLDVAIERGDTALANQLAGEILETLHSVLYSEPVATTYTELKSRLATDSRERLIDRASEAERDVRDLLNSPSFAFGQWAAAAELAARTHHGSFFESSHGTDFIRSTAQVGLFQDDSAALRTIDDTRMKQGLDGRTLEAVDEVLKATIRRRGG